MDTDLLRTFIAVSKSRHFGRAAENLYLTQSAVSFRIRQLEQQLGVSLFTRHRNNIQLTAAGERLLPYAENILQTLGQAKQVIAQQAVMQQQLAIGAPAFCWELGLQEWLDPWFANRESTLCLRTETGHREQLCRQLLERTLDLAILVEPSKIDEITVRPFCDYPLALVCRQAAQSLHTLSAAYVHVEGLLPAQLFPTELQGRTTVLMTASLQQAIKHLLRHGGMAYLPHPAVAPYIRQGQLHLVDGAVNMSRPLYLACRNDVMADEEIGGLLRTQWQPGAKVAARG